MASFLGLLTYFSVNVANIVFYWRFRREKFNIFLNGVVPVFGVAVVCYILYESYLASLWNAGWTYGRRGPGVDDLAQAPQARALRALERGIRGACGGASVTKSCWHRRHLKAT